MGARGAAHMQLQFANGQGLTKFCGSHEIFITEINNFGKFAAFHENFVQRKFGAIRCLSTYGIVDLALT